MSIDTTATRYLDSHSIPYQVFIHKKTPISVEEAARERHQEPGQVIRSILFRHASDEFILVLIPGLCRVSWRKIRLFLKISRISLASKEEVLRVTGYDLGTVTPFGLQNKVRILVDERVFLPSQVSLGSGVRGTAIILSTTYLKQALESLEMGDLAL
jgi:Cys-tRNA(Pro)/Cys-tRNA(Cys) deacylase